MRGIFGLVRLDAGETSRPARKRGDGTAAEHLVRRFADRFWTTHWPG
jgi:hypothetical protein